MQQSDMYIECYRQIQKKSTITAREVFHSLKNCLKNPHPPPPKKKKKKEETNCFQNLNFM